MDRRNRAGWIGLQRTQLALENRAAAVIFVAKIDVDLVDADRPRRDKRALDEPMGITLEVVAIFERARLAFVDVDGHQTWRRFSRDDLPFASRGKPRTAESSQTRVFHRGDDVLAFPLAVDARGRECVPALRP